MLFLQLAGLLAWLLLTTFPLRLGRNSGHLYQQVNLEHHGGIRTSNHSLFTHLTATGIAPDLHRISLFILPQGRNQLRGANVEKES